MRRQQVAQPSVNLELIVAGKALGRAGIIRDDGQRECLARERLPGSPPFRERIT